MVGPPNLPDSGRAADPFVRAEAVDKNVAGRIIGSEYGGIGGGVYGSPVFRGDFSAGWQSVFPSSHRDLDHDLVWFQDSLRGNPDHLGSVQA
jgi:hypothetical protein